MSELLADQQKPHEELEQIARLLIVDSDTLDDEEFAYWKAVGFRFLEELSSESFYSRFGAPKPEKPQELDKFADSLEQELYQEKLMRYHKDLMSYVEHFVSSSGKHHTMFLLMQEDRLIGAATLFDYTNTAIPNTNTVVEISVTRADDKPKLGTATELLKRARSYAYASGKTHCYASFDKGNTKSRQLVNHVFKVKNVAAGKDSLTDKFYRLPGVKAEDHTELEHAMKIMCGDALEEPDEVVIDAKTKRRAITIRLGRSATRQKVDKKQKK